MFKILDHIRRPVIVNLETTQLYITILYINPAVRNNIVHGLDMRFIYQINLRNENAKSHVITIRKSCCNPCCIRRHIVHTSNQILYRHGGNHVITIHLYLLAILYIGYSGKLILCILMDLRNLGILNDCTAKLLHLRCSHIPQLSGAELGILKFLNQGSLHFTVLFLENLTKDIF